MITKIGDTIVSKVTPNGISGVGILRISGELSYIISFLITKKHMPVRFAIYTSFFDKNSELIDKGIAIFYKSPNSFTGEDVLELHSHGSNVILNNILLRCIELGARKAEKGEFSFRAFFNNKIDLLQAESIDQLIKSNSSYANKAILKSLDGIFSSKINFIIGKLLLLRRDLEASIDFPSDVELDNIGFINKFDDLYICFIKLLEKVSKNYFLYDKFEIVIFGKTNVGKSSLFNLLLGSDRSIVSNIPGTTRDYLDCNINIGNHTLSLIDTAGLNNSTNDIIEKEGINRTYKQIKHANILIYMLDINDNINLNCDDIFKYVKKISTDKFKLFIINNKIDKIKIKPKIIVHDDYIELYISVKKKLGLNLLLKELNKIFSLENDDLYMVNKRHFNLFFKAHKHLLSARKKIHNNFLFDLLAEDLRLMHNDLSSMVGLDASNELLTEIFSNFCLGK